MNRIIICAGCKKNRGKRKLMSLNSDDAWYQLELLTDCPLSVFSKHRHDPPPMKG